MVLKENGDSLGEGREMKYMRLLNAWTRRKKMSTGMRSLGEK
jgi:hypothetical protein